LQTIRRNTDEFRNRKSKLNRQTHTITKISVETQSCRSQTNRQNIYRNEADEQKLDTLGKRYINYTDKQTVTGRKPTDNIDKWRQTDYRQTNRKTD